MNTFICSKDGNVYYRTKLIRDSARADRFRKCLAANRRFRNVSVVKSAQSTGVAFFVQYQPASAGRYADLFHEQYRKRESRAHAEQPGYTWSLSTRCVNAWYLCQTLTGETYEVTEGTCTCADYQFRARKAGLPCKHSLAYVRAVALGEIRPLFEIRLDLRFGRPVSQIATQSAGAASAA